VLIASTNMILTLSENGGTTLVEPLITDAAFSLQKPARALGLHPEPGTLAMLALELALLTTRKVRGTPRVSPAAPAAAPEGSVRSGDRPGMGRFSFSALAYARAGEDFRGHKH
jgi:hypothetical protein